MYDKQISLVSMSYFWKAQLLHQVTLRSESNIIDDECHWTCLRSFIAISGYWFQEW